MPAIILIRALPTFVSPEEHQNLVGSTPTSFKDIPPVVRHREDNVSITLDPALEGFTAEDAAKGTLYVLTSVLVYVSSTTGCGFQIEYPSITLHAVSRAELGQSIYCQLDESAGSADAGGAGGEDGIEMRELSIVPTSADSLEPIFDALSQCASLHPDKDAGEEDDFDNDDAFIEADRFETFIGDEDQELSEVGRAALAHLESIIDDPFDDATEQPNGTGERLANTDVAEKNDTDKGV